MKNKRRTSCVLKPLTFAMLVAPLAAAANANTDAYQEKLDSVLSDPSNPQTSFDFVKEAVSIGDLRGAIGALERILKLDPGLFNIRLELGSLYNRVGSYDLAANYIRQALKDPSMPLEERAKAKQLLAQAEKSTQRSFTSGYLRLGVIHDDNANAGPESASVLVNGQVGELDEADTGQSDNSLELQGYLQYLKHMDSQRDNRWELDLLTYNRLYSELNTINSNLIQVTAGPRLSIGKMENQDLYVKPFMKLSNLWLDGETYRTSAGAGIDLTKYWSRARGGLKLAGESQDFSNTDERPTASERTGDFYSLSGSYEYQTSPRTRLLFGAYFSQRNSEKDYESYDESGLNAALQYAFSPGTKQLTRAWRSTLSASLATSKYDAIDPQIGSTSPRSDDRASLRWSVAAPLSPNWNISASLGYTDNASNIVNFEYDNWNAGLSATYAF